MICNSLMPQLKEPKFRPKILSNTLFYFYFFEKNKIDYSFFINEITVIINSKVI